MTDQRPTKVYPATVTDAKIITWPIWFPILTVLDLYKPDAQEGMILLVWPFAAIDLPLAVIIDTLCLPADLWGHNGSISNGVTGTNNAANHAPEDAAHKVADPQR